MATNTQKMAAGLAAAAAAAGAAAAGYYFYASDDAKQHRRLAAKWAKDLKSDVVRQAKKVQDIDRAQMLKIIDGAAATYETVRSVNRADMTRAVRELKSNWQRLAAEVTGGVKRAGTSTPARKRAAKKAAPKRAAAKKARRSKS